MLPLDSHRCESGGIHDHTVTDNPAQGRPTVPRAGNVPLAREAQRQTTPTHARPRENTMAPQPSVTDERNNDNRTGPSSSMNEEVPRTASLEEEPLRNEEGRMCLLTSSHYILSGSVGPSPSAMRPFHMALDTGSGYNVIRLRDLPQLWENYRIPDASVPALGDANGNRLRLLGQVVLRVRFGSAMYRVSFLVAERLAVSVIIGTAFMNRHIRGIMCMDGEIKLTRATIPILSVAYLRGTQVAPQITSYLDTTQRQRAVYDRHRFQRLRSGRCTLSTARRWGPNVVGHHRIWVQNSHQGAEDLLCY